MEQQLIEKNENYGANDIRELKFPQTVREKVGMYLGDGGQQGFFHTLIEILDNSIDEFVAGHGSSIDITIDSKTNRCSIRDYGRGIPFGINNDGVSALVLAMTTLHAGGKHRSLDGKSSYKYSSGINGVGASVVNGVSNYFHVEVIRENTIALVTWENGVISKELQIIPNYTNKKNGTYVEWIPSVKVDEFDHHNVFESDCLFTKEDIIEKLQYIPFLNSGLEIKLCFDGANIFFKKQETPANILKLRSQKLVMETSPLYKEELVLLLNRSSGGKKVLNMSEFLELSEEEKGKFEVKSSLIELAFNFTTNSEPLQLSFANGVKISGGKPDQAFKLSMKNTINNFLLSQKKKTHFEQEDIFSNLSFMLSVKINQPSFSGQTKDKLNNPESGTITKHFMDLFLEHWINRADKKEFEMILQILETSQQARKNSSKIMSEAFKSISELSGAQLLKSKGKLVDCSSNDATRNELFIVEGDSAAGPVSQARSSKYQAFLALKGKPMNVIKKANQSKIFNNEEIKSLAYALGGLGDDFKIEKLKYQKIIILADADLDGFHISALMMTFFYHFYPEIIKAGYLFIGVAPLYKISYSKTKYEWAWNDADLQPKIEGKKGFKITRNKGLGEMEAIDLFDTTLNPVTRQLIKVSMDDMEVAKRQIGVFMGDERESKLVLKQIIKDYYANQVKKES